MRVLGAEFLISAAKPTDWPKGPAPEIAFCGRSNVGKSSLLNVLLGRRSLARVSNTPGRTRLINFFSLRAALSNERGAPIDLRLADLPGFGYAKVSKAERATWRPLIQEYLSHRADLKVVVLLLDSRRVLDLKQDPDALAEEFDLFHWLRGLGKAVVPVMTKADKLAKHERKPAASLLQQALGTAPVVFSAQSGEGVDALWRRVAAGLAAQEATTEPGGAGERPA